MRTEEDINGTEIKRRITEQIAKKIRKKNEGRQEIRNKEDDN
jgi:hypothetical protein